MSNVLYICKLKAVWHYGLPNINTTYAKNRTIVARARSVGGLDGRRQAHKEVFTASSGTSSNSPD